jgi:hypothetical protein
MPQRRGLRRGSEGVEQLLNQLTALALVINIFLLPTVFYIEYSPNLMYLERGLYSPLFSTFCLEKRLRPPGKISRCSILGLYLPTLKTGVFHVQKSDSKCANSAASRKLVARATRHGTVGQIVLLVSLKVDEIYPSA